MTGDLSLTERLAHHLNRPVGEEDRARARLHLLDWLGCVLGARRSDVAKMARRAEPDVLTRAALLGNLFEMDDVHRTAILHPGPVVWPSALSAARQEMAPMDALLSAAVRGYEAVIAVGATFDARHYCVLAQHGYRRWLRCGSGGRVALRPRCRANRRGARYGRVAGGRSVADAP